MQQIRTKSGEAGVHPDDYIGRGKKTGGETCQTRLGMEKVENTEGQTVVSKTDKRPISYVLDACCRLHSVQYWYNF